MSVQQGHDQPGLSTRTDSLPAIRRMGGWNSAALQAASAPPTMNADRMVIRMLSDLLMVYCCDDYRRGGPSEGKHRDKKSGDKGKPAFITVWSLVQFSGLLILVSRLQRRAINQLSNLSCSNSPLSNGRESTRSHWSSSDA